MSGEDVSGERAERHLREAMTAVAGDGEHLSFMRDPVNN